MKKTLRPADTDPETWEVMLNLWRQMDASTRLAHVIQLNNDCREVVMCGIRSRHPDYSEDQVPAPGLQRGPGQTSRRPDLPGR